MPEQDVHFMSSRTHRFLLLDGLRGLAAIVVLVYHAANGLTGHRLAPRGYLAVDLFFVLSGFVIAFSYEARLAGNLKLRSFAVARFIRLYPVFFLAMGVSLLLRSIMAHIQHERSPWSAGVLASFLMVPDFFHRGASSLFPINVPAWSLFFEVVANLAYAALVCLRIARTAFLVLLCSAFLAWLSILVFTVYGTFGGGHTWDTIWTGFARVGWSFLAGVLIYRFLRISKKPLFTNIKGWLSSAAIFLVVGIVLSTSLMHSALAQVLTVAILFPAVVYFGARTSLPQSISRVSAFFGDVSYPLYLLHVPLLAFSEGRTYTRLNATHPFLLVVALPLFAVTVVCFSWWISQTYDRPARKFLTAHYNRMLTSRSIVEPAPSA